MSNYEFMFNLETKAAFDTMNWQNKKTSLLVFIFIILSGLYYIYALNPSYIFTGDSLNKLVQADSILKSGFTSEALRYNAIDLDSEFRFYPFPGAYHLTIGSRHLGQYPLFFSFLSALVLKFFPVQVFPFIGFGIFLFLIFLLRREFGISNFLLLVVSFCSYLFSLALDYSENIYTVLFTFSGFLLYLRSLDTAFVHSGKMIVAGFLMGIGVWLRLEGLLLFFSISCGFIFVYRFKNRNEFLRFLWFGIGFGITTLAFFAFNFWDYGHILGPRYLANSSGFTQSVFDRIIQMITLLFAGKFKVGYFVFTPLFFVSLFYFAIPKNFREGSNQVKILVISLLIFFPIAALSAPNDGVVTWGPRYLAHALLPNIILLHYYFQKISFYENKIKPLSKILINLSLFISLVLSFAGFKFLTVATKQLKQFQSEIDSVKSELRIFQNSFLINHTGTSYLESKNVLIENQNELAIFLRSVKEKKTVKSISFYHSDFDYVKNSDLFSYRMKPEAKEAYLKLLSSELKFIRVQTLKQLEIYQYSLE